MQTQRLVIRSTFTVASTTFYTRNAWRSCTSHHSHFNWQCIRIKVKQKTGQAGIGTLLAPQGKMVKASCHELLPFLHSNFKTLQVYIAAETDTQTCTMCLHVNIDTKLECRSTDLNLLTHKAPQHTIFINHLHYNLQVQEQNMWMPCFLPLQLSNGWRGWNEESLRDEHRVEIVLGGYFREKMTKQKERNWRDNVTGDVCSEWSRSNDTDTRRWAELVVTN